MTSLYVIRLPKKRIRSQKVRIPEYPENDFRKPRLIRRRQPATTAISHTLIWIAAIGHGIGCKQYGQVLAFWLYGQAFHQGSCSAAFRTTTRESALPLRSHGALLYAAGSIRSMQQPQASVAGGARRSFRWPRSSQCVRLRLRSLQLHLLRKTSTRVSSCHSRACNFAFFLSSLFP